MGFDLKGRRRGGKEALGMGAGGGVPAVAEGEWKGASEWEGREKSWSPALLHAGARRREGSVGLGERGTGSDPGLQIPESPT